MGANQELTASKTLSRCLEKHKPFLICRCDSWMAMAPETVVPMWTLEVMRGNGLLRSYEIDGTDAMEAIMKFGIPLLHKLDGNNCIWGDPDFKKVYIKRRNERRGEDEYCSEGV